MKNTIKKSISVLMCILMLLSCLNGSVFTEIGTLIAQAADGSSLSAGDINGDGTVNNKDLTRLLKHIAGEDVEVISQFLDTNGDGTVNNKDLTRLLKYIAGEDVIIHPIGCIHELEAVEAVEATCTENGNIAYWQCSLCGDLFSDENGATEITTEDIVDKAKGHTEEIIPAVAPTYDDYGSTEGVKCSVCDTIIIAPEPVEPLEKDEVYVEYDVRGNLAADSYLKNEIAKLVANGEKLHINESAINTTEKSYNLRSIPVDTVPGYTFLGWYDGPNESAKRITTIAKGETGYLELFAHWKLVEYEIQFDSPDIPVESVTYTVNKGKTLNNPDEQFGYTFVGWSNDDGFIVNSIKPGTTGEITLHANWTSNRNKATSYENYGKPIIIEDSKNGQFLFVYDIGKIENVPLKEIQKPWNSEGTEIDTTYSFSTYIDGEVVKGVVNSVSEATTKSSGWVLSKEWDEIYEAGEEYANKQVKSEERTDSEGNVVGGKYFISNSEGGASYTSVESGGTSSTSAKVTTDKSFGINKSYDESTETYVDAKLNAEFKHENGVEASFPVEFVNIGASVNNTITVGGELASGRKDNTAYHCDSSLSGYVGTVNTQDSSKYYNTTANSASNWNSTSSFEQSYDSSRETSITDAISNEIAKTTNYNITSALGGGESQTYNLDEASKKSDEYSHTAKYAEGTTTEKTVSFKTKASGNGNYRIVMAATIHVYGVVGYDVKTNSYYTYTYDVLSDDRNLFLDFSRDTTTFDDCENGLVTFEIPYEVNEYILGVTGQTNGLTFGENNDTVTEFATPKNFDGTVVVPQYQSANNAGDGTYSAIKVTKIDPTAFKGNEDIKTVVLPLYVTEIPEGAFEGCTNLETVIAFGVTKIGKNAFKGCSSLKSFMIDNHITDLGENAFADTNEACSITVMAANSKVADAAIKSGAKNVTLNISKLSDSYDNKKIEITENFDSFSLISDGREYTNLQLDSKAKKMTYISNVKFTKNTDTPITISSPEVTLARVSVVDAPGFALILKGDNVDLKLYSNIQLGTIGENAIISKNVTLLKHTASYEGKITASGNYLVCGKITNENLLIGESKVIDETEYDSYLTSSIISFDANGGSISDATKTVYYGQLYGELPVPTRANYTFEGWYTAKDGGTKITAETSVTALVNETLYAHWIPNKFTLTYNANGGIVSPGSKELTFGDSYGTLPTPKRDYYTFLGWYTATSGGTQVSASTTPTSATNVTIYAQWKLNDVKGWVKASEMPAGAEVTQTKWTYTLREYKTNSASSLSGWTKYDTKHTSWTEWGSWSAWSTTSVSKTDSRDVETKTVAATYKTQYNYSRYRSSDGWSGPWQGTWGGHYCGTYQERGWTDSRLAVTGRDGYGSTMFDIFGGAGDGSWYNEKTRQVQTAAAYTMYRYRDRSPVYTYYYYRDVHNKEATSDPTNWSDTSNEVKWVMYRPK